jgi:hypothetical protein
MPASYHASAYPLPPNLTTFWRNASADTATIQAWLDENEVDHVEGIENTPVTCSCQRYRHSSCTQLSDTYTAEKAANELVTVRPANASLQLGPYVAGPLSYRLGDVSVPLRCGKNSYW